MSLYITFPGTGSGKTSLTRFHSSLLISDSIYNLLVDAGDGISRALLKQNISYNSISGVLLSHLHPDHYSGLTSLIVQMKMVNRKEPLTIFVHRSLIKTIKDYLQTSYIFMERTDFFINYRGYDFSEEITVSSELSFICRSNTHLKKYERYDSSLSYACGSFLFKYGEKNIYYSGDIGGAEDLHLFKDYKIDLFIAEAAHANIDDLVSVYNKLKPRRIVITHLSDEDTQEIKLRSTNVDMPVIIAEDGLRLSV
ncbi:MAG TPA: MBL fold metallo-hydrolase [Ignavibacteriaceae bacterium]|nr:MBL fold metallo-hydrolase [Ignavibacteriaceae bacterium]